MEHPAFGQQIRSLFSRLARHQTALVLFVIFATYFFFGFSHLAQFITTDEHYWFYERVPAYWDAWQSGKLEKTYINDKPGVTVALVSGIGLLVEPHPETVCLKHPDKTIDCDVNRVGPMLSAFRVPIIFVNAGLLLFIFFAVRRFSGRRIAIFTTLLTALSPILLGMSQIVNPDALLWSFSAASIFAFLTLLRTREKKFLIFSGIFLGFAILSKYVASILVPFFLLVSALHLLMDNASDKKHAERTARGNLAFFAAVILIAVCVIEIFLPAAWLKPRIIARLLSSESKTVQYLPLLFTIIAIIATDTLLLRSRLLLALRTFLRKNKAALPTILRLLAFSVFILFMTLLVGRFLFPHWELFSRIPFDSKDLTGDARVFGPEPTLPQFFLLEANPLAFSLTPILLLFLLWFLLRVTLAPAKMARFPLESFSVIAIFPIVFSVFIASDILAIPRYLILLFPLAAFLAALGIDDFLRFLGPVLSRMRHSAIFVRPTLLVAVLTASIWSLHSVFPYPVAYTNAFLPKNALISHSWGYGGYEAARYLNALPDARHLTVWSDYLGLCEFFIGNCIEMDYKYTARLDIDYVVLSYRGKILYQPDHTRWQKNGNFYAEPAYDYPYPDWEVFIDGHPDNFIKVVRLKGL